MDKRRGSDGRPIVFTLKDLQEATIAQERARRERIALSKTPCGDLGRRIYEKLDPLGG